MPDRAELHEQKAQVLLEIGEAWNALKAATRMSLLQSYIPRILRPGYLENITTVLIISLFFIFLLKCPVFFLLAGATILEPSWAEVCKFYYLLGLPMSF